MKIVLAPGGPLDVAATLARYHLWGEDPANRVTPDRFRRVLAGTDRLLPYEVRWEGPVDAVRLHVHVPGARGPAVRDRVVQEVRAVFGLDFDLAGFYRFARSDRTLAPLVERLYGLRPTLAPSPLEMLVGSICAQQVNLSFAFTLRARLVRRYGRPAAIGGEVVHAFPRPADLAGAHPRTLRAMQFSGAKARAIRGVARALAGGQLDLAVLRAAPNADVIARLTALRGLGRWSAEWFLARCLGRGDVCPAGDLGVRKAFARYCSNGGPPDEEAIRRRAAAWGAYQNLAVHYLLAGLRLEHSRAGGAA